MNFRRFLIVLLLLRLYPSLVWADDSRVVPSVAVREEYNTNILFSGYDIKRDAITTVSPGVEIVDRSDRLDTDLSARLDLLDYSHHRDLNAINQTYNGKLGYLTSPLSHISVEAGYLRNYNPSLEAGMPSTGYTVVKPLEPQPADPGTGPGLGPGSSPGPSPSPSQVQPQAAYPAIPVVAIPVNQITSSLSADYSYTEKAAAMASYNYARNYYKDTRYQDGTSHTVNAGFMYDFGQYLSLVKGNLNMGFSYYDFPDSINESVIGTVGFSRDLDKVWSLRVDGGIRRTWSEIWITQPVLSSDQVINGHEILTYTNERERLKNKGWGKVGSASLHFQGEYVYCDIAYVRDLTMASGLNGAAERNAVTFSTVYRLTYELSLYLTTGYSALKSDSSNYSPFSINQRTFNLGPGLRYDFSKDAAVEASYAFARVDGTESYAAANSPATNTEAKKHLTFIRLYIQHAFLE
jgi:hypothetical protein